ncbi:hypothetical protein CCP1ISM_220007 [Azospirillaceae bacterium]
MLSSSLRIILITEQCSIFNSFRNEELTNPLRSDWLIGLRPFIPILFTDVRFPGHPHESASARLWRLLLVKHMSLPTLNASHSRTQSAKERRRDDENDTGALYASADFQALLKRYGMRGPTSRKGNCWDKAFRRNNRSIFLGLVVPRVVATPLVYLWYTARSGA